MPVRKPAPGTFEIGLVMAGAVSAGAYTAGVIDFLFEALDAWESAKASGIPDIPDHNVQIRVASGTSAGGIVSALTAMVPFTGHFPVRDLAKPGAAAATNTDRSLLYRCWVKEINIGRLLQTSDIGSQSGVVPSLLDGNAVARVAEIAVETARKAMQQALPPAPRYMANPLQLYLCVTNMRGLPYMVQMVTAGGVRGHRVVSHADYGHFAVFGTGASPRESLPIAARPVNWPGTAGNLKADGWDQLMAAALCTSAFPVGLPARPFDNDLALYQTTPWPRPAGIGIDEPPPTLSPDLSPAVSRPYQYWCVDGGLLNNEPLEFARIALSGAPDVRNERDPLKADRAVLMIDPFPDDIGSDAPPQGGQPDMLGTAFSLLPILKAHARFKPEEVMLALHEDIYSRFLIAPVREGKKRGETDLASAGLAGFAGFLSERFRIHDFQIGRRNCQKFLRDHFVIHRDNPIVADWTKRLAAKGQLDRYQHRDDPDYVQLIPLLGGAEDEAAPLPWPVLDRARDFDALHDLVEARTDKVAPEIIRGLFRLVKLDDKKLVGRIIRAVLNPIVGGKVVDAVMGAIEKDLVVRGLLPGDPGTAEDDFPVGPDSGGP